MLLLINITGNIIVGLVTLIWFTKFTASLFSPYSAFTSANINITSAILVTLQYNN